MERKEKQLLIASIIGILCFGASTALVFSGLMENVDSKVYSLIYPFIKPELTHAAVFITNFGDVPYVLILPVLFIILPATRIKYGLPSFLTLGSAAVLNQILKAVFQRPRPDILRLVTEHGFSFPSGHTMSNAAFYTIIILLFCKYTKSKIACAAVSCLSILTAFTIGISRIYLGVHYFSDVLSGMILGASIGCIGFLIYSRVENYFHTYNKKAR